MQNRIARIVFAIVCSLAFVAQNAVAQAKVAGVEVTKQGVTVRSWRFLDPEELFKDYHNAPQAQIVNLTCADTAQAGAIINAEPHTFGGMLQRLNALRAGCKNTMQGSFTRNVRLVTASEMSAAELLGYNRVDAKTYTTNRSPWKQKGFKTVKELCLYAKSDKAYQNLLVSKDKEEGAEVLRYLSNSCETLDPHVSEIEAPIGALVAEDLGLSGAAHNVWLTEPVKLVQVETEDGAVRWFKYSCANEDFPVLRVEYTISYEVPAPKFARLAISKQVRLWDHAATKRYSDETWAKSVTVDSTQASQLMPVQYLVVVKSVGDATATNVQVRDEPSVRDGRWLILIDPNSPLANPVNAGSLQPGDSLVYLVHATARSGWVGTETNHAFAKADNASEVQDVAQVIRQKAPAPVAVAEAGFYCGRGFKEAAVCVLATCATVTVVGDAAGYKNICGFPLGGTEEKTGNKPVGQPITQLDVISLRSGASLSVGISPSPVASSQMQLRNSNLIPILPSVGSRLSIRSYQFNAGVSVGFNKIQSVLGKFAK
ncbi:MAG: hypothetical protein JWO40_502 [Candidatus Doudnabacteria bacterium]|nr:hypothetical protein [Candidatus Doudnabacteria bacterium]